jgi:hypothetical protein
MRSAAVQVLRDLGTEEDRVADFGEDEDEDGDGDEFDNRPSDEERSRALATIAESRAVAEIGAALDVLRAEAPAAPFALLGVATELPPESLFHAGVPYPLPIDVDDATCEALLVARADAMDRLTWAAANLGGWKDRGQCLAILLRRRPDHPEVLELAISALRNDPDDDIVRVAASHLLCHHVPDHDPVLESVERIAGSRGMVRDALIAALHDAAGQQAARLHAPLLVAALDHRPDIRLAVAALAATGTLLLDASVDLLEATNDGWDQAGPVLKEWALAALAEHRTVDNAVDGFMVHALNDPDPNVRAQAARLVTAIPGITPDALPDIDPTAEHGASGWTAVHLRGAGGGGGAGSGGS